MKHFFTLFLLLSLTSLQGQTIVTFYTTMGDFEVEMADTIVPHTTGNFIRLTNIRYYDGVIFHRIIDGFVVQGGDPTGTGAGGPNHLIMDEFDPRMSNVEMTISMANTGQPHSGSSQFFFNLVDNTRLDYTNPAINGHAVFGIVVANWDTVKAIGRVATDANDRPIVPVVMDSVRVTYSPFSTGLPSLGEAMDIQVYPNPLTPRSLIAITADRAKTVSISLYDQLGRQMASQEAQLVRGLNQLPFSELRERALPAGVYFLLVNEGNTFYRTQVVVR